VAEEVGDADRASVTVSASSASVRRPVSQCQCKRPSVHACLSTRPVPVSGAGV